ncbi:hypothetical protein T492DRAFT_926822 [Pavlovales sp. CCMP2436]|nr:hypothetical protein T492DRAFT_926822 [Pavlovales sp. CCMP2436]
MGGVSGFAFLGAVCALAAFPGGIEGAALLRSVRIGYVRACITCSQPGPRPQPFSATESELDSAAPTVGRGHAGLRSRIGRAQKWVAGTAGAMLVFGASSRPAQAFWPFQPPPPPPEEVKAWIEIKIPDMSWMQSKTTDPDQKEAERKTGEAVAIGIIALTALRTLQVNRRENKDEFARIKAETERLDKLQEDFLLDEDVIIDDDLFSSLRKRMEKTDGPVEPDRPAGFDPEAPEPAAPVAAGDTSSTPPRPTPPATGDAAPEGDAPAAEEEEDQAARDADIERLKRMFGGGK